MQVFYLLLTIYFYVNIDIPLTRLVSIIFLTFLFYITF
ncbi:hypothetical protein ymoll0001_12160 [Yersinia mollaretii ATCC 43969]|uniref:Uncharacterized protein n=1 Tax=Yersinia mollaretii (strain ATCC 43969 / DSM 18520 / CIP 103324 / CNY 7263 / WAIP 204) TaxID=349967 RepID=A0ABM9YF28_YERMW|nr:hypothetical protein ymoll0001_12160 [Yersinia mollaretii ATCC 43969]